MTQLLWDKRERRFCRIDDLLEKADSPEHFLDHLLQEVKEVGFKFSVKNSKLICRMIIMRT